MDSKADFIKSLIREVPDFPKKGILFYDITTLLLNHEGLAASIDMLAGHWKDRGVTKVASLESRGFIFGTVVALKLGVGFVPLRKPGKLPYDKVKEEYSLEYGTDTIEMHVDAVGDKDNVLIVDDLLATGGSAAAATRLISSRGAKIAGAAFVIELGFLNGREKIRDLPEIQSIVVY
ncbi:MAG: adenine phosphoribosyltransferase [Pseudomonadota bacterium]